MHTASPKRCERSFVSVLRFVAERAPDLAEVLAWYETQLLLLNNEDRRIDKLLRSDPDLIPREYFGLTFQEVRDQFDASRKHLLYAGLLHLLTTTEALLRLRFQALATHDRSQKISRDFRRIKRNRGNKIRLDEDILETWRSLYPDLVRPIGQFRGVIPLRDWLAHGRHWNPKMSRPSYTIQDVFEIADEMRFRMNEAS